MSHDRLVVSPGFPHALRRSVLRTLSVAGLGALAATLHAPLLAQPFPNKPITLIVPYAPGGSVDVIGRVVAQALSQQMGQTVVVENRAGAGGAIGVGAVARAAPDGYTLLFTSLGAMTVTVHLTKVAFDPLKDFAPISLVARSGLVLAVHPSSPIHTVQDLIAAARAKPGTINYSVTGVGSQTFLAGELIKRAAKIDMMPVQYKGGGPAAAAVAAGEVPVGITDSGPILPFAKASKVRLIAVTGATRASSMPDVPTLQESGLPDLQIDSGLALFAPAGTAPALVAQVSAAVRDVLRQPDVAERIRAASHEPVGDTPAQLDAFVKSEYAKYGAVIRETGIKLE